MYLWRLASIRLMEFGKLWQYLDKFCSHRLESGGPMVTRQQQGHIHYLLSLSITCMIFLSDFAQVRTPAPGAAWARPAVPRRRHAGRASGRSRSTPWASPAASTAAARRSLPRGSRPRQSRTSNPRTLSPAARPACSGRAPSRRRPPRAEVETRMTRWRTWGTRSPASLATCNAS